MTSTNGPTLVGVFGGSQEAERGLDELYQAGFDSKDVGFAMRHDEGAPAGAVTNAPPAKDGEGAVKGMVAGGLTGGLLGAAAVLVIPGVGPLLAMGMLASALGFGAAGVATGGILGAVVALDISEEESRLYEKELHAGHAIVTVNARGRNLEGRQILERCGAHHIHSESGHPSDSVSAV